MDSSLSLWSGRKRRSFSHLREPTTFSPGPGLELADVVESVLTRSCLSIAEVARGGHQETIIPTWGGGGLVHEEDPPRPMSVSVRRNNILSVYYHNVILSMGDGV